MYEQLSRLLSPRQCFWDDGKSPTHSAKDSSGRGAEKNVYSRSCKRDQTEGWSLQSPHVH
jgi:hypothetical protein